LRQVLDSSSEQTAKKENFLTKLEKLSAQIWEKELYNRPFLVDLIEGKLPREKFRRYLIQDYHYLGRFAQAMAMATARGPDLFTVKVFGTHLKITLEYEFPRVWKMMTRFGVRKSAFDSSRPLPGTIAYTDFLFDTCSKCSSAEAVAAIYPCNFSYRELGKKIRPALKKYYNIPDNFISFSLYQRRIFLESATNTLEVLSRGAANASATQEKRILDKFYKATKLEKGFWDQAYND
jgi:thiaminase (transcriptional activator TenA)